MDDLRRDTIRLLLQSADDLLLNDAVVLRKSSSHSHTPTETEDRGQKSHIPSVTTVPREVPLISDDRQARRRPIAVREGQTKKTFPLPATATEKTIVADASLSHNTPNNVGGARLDNRSTPAAERGSIADSLSGEEAVGSATPNMVKSRGSTQDVTICEPTVTVKSDKPRKQVAPFRHGQYQPTAVLCYKCGRRYQPDVDGYLQHHPRFCRSRR